ncbi:hypothetical protein [Paenibacillus sp. YYML68]|uniref:hypothetical protein n=1 Tax=Paenibacillus sp. YYML68 TaxID=2909250 RepID=UPI0024916E4F|nr:hypothetical protein [Paenibacillus sp. YYML68]
MKAKINQTELESKLLSWLCIQPMLAAVRGKDLQTKLAMYNQLHEGQKALFLFYSFHNHTKTIAEFYWFSAYNINELQTWKGIRAGVLYFADVSMAELLDEIESLIVTRNKFNKVISPTDLEVDQHLLNEVKELYDKYMEHAALTIERMNNWIRINQEEFIEKGEPCTDYV